MGMNLHCMNCDGPLPKNLLRFKVTRESANGDTTEGYWCRLCWEKVAPDAKPERNQTPEQQVQSAFLGRLERLIRLRSTYAEDLNPLGLRLLDRAIDATYRDCIDYGAADAARPVMAQHRRRFWRKEGEEQTA